MITPKFIAGWFLLSACIFVLFLLLKEFLSSDLSDDNQFPRDWNAFFIMLSQGFGALIAYAIY